MYHNASYTWCAWYPAHPEGVYNIKKPLNTRRCCNHGKKLMISSLTFFGQITSKYHCQWQLCSLATRSSTAIDHWAAQWGSLWGRSYSRPSRGSGRRWLITLIISLGKILNIHAPPGRSFLKHSSVSSLDFLELCRWKYGKKKVCPMLSKCIRVQCMIQSACMILHEQTVRCCESKEKLWKSEANTDPFSMA